MHGNQSNSHHRLRKDKPNGRHTDSCYSDYRFGKQSGLVDFCTHHETRQLTNTRGTHYAHHNQNKALQHPRRLAQDSPRLRQQNRTHRNLQIEIRWLRRRDGIVHVAKDIQQKSRLSTTFVVTAKPRLHLQSSQVPRSLQTRSGAAGT